MSTKEEEEESRPTVDNGPSNDRKQWLGMEEERDVTQDPRLSLCSSKSSPFSPDTLSCPLEKAEVSSGDLNSFFMVAQQAILPTEPFP